MQGGACVRCVWEVHVRVCESKSKSKRERVRESKRERERESKREG